MGRSKHEEILGEVDPGFNLWTSAHGFHHLSLTNRKGNINYFCVNFSNFDKFSLQLSTKNLEFYRDINLIGWQIGWAFILLVVALGLIAILVYYFVYVFSTAIYSRVIVESPDKDGNILSIQ